MTNEELVKEIQLGHDVQSNIATLWEQVEKFIYMILLPFKENYKQEYEDLVQESYFALLDAVKGYEADKGCKFTTYLSYWIKQKAISYIHTYGRVKRISEYMQARINKYKALLSSTETVPTDREIMMKLGIDKRQYDTMLRTIHEMDTISLDKKIDGKDNSSMDISEIIGDGKDLAADVTDSLTLSQIWWYVDELDERRKQVIIERYKENKTQETISHEFGVSRNRIADLEKEALKQLRRKDRVKYLAKEFGYDCSLAYSGSVGAFNRKGSCVERVAIKHLELSERYNKAMNKINELDSLIESMRTWDGTRTYQNDSFNDSEQKGTY
ncbi:RNA polymerase sigma factor RpoD [Lachnospiraceae bacterium TWA4]|nr:RNA polymerase sigma factor RpoD [Lachnospiraceae bacterium TWA4]